MQPLEEIVGVPGVAPKAFPAGLALAVRPRLETGQLPVRHRFADDRHHADNHAQHHQRRPEIQLPADHPERQGERPGQARLQPEHHQEHRLGGFAQPLAHGGVATVLAALAGDAAENMAAQPHRPEQQQGAGRQARQGVAAAGQQVGKTGEPGAEAPGHIHVAGIAVGPLHRPGQGEHHHQQNQTENQNFRHNDLAPHRDGAPDKPAPVPPSTTRRRSSVPAATSPAGWWRRRS